MTYANIYDVYEHETTTGNKARTYFANVDIPKRGKFLAELIAEHEGKTLVFGQEKRFPRKDVYFDSLPGNHIGATVYNVAGQIKVHILIIGPVDNAYILEAVDDLKAA